MATSERQASHRPATRQQTDPIGTLKSIIEGSGLPVEEFW